MLCGTAFEFDPVGSGRKSQGVVCSGSCGYLPVFHSRNLGSVPVSACRIWGNTGKGLTSSILQFSHLYHSVSALYSFGHLSPSCVTVALLNNTLRNKGGHNAAVLTSSAA